MIGDWVNYRPGWIDEETKEVVYEIKTGFPIRLTCLYDGLSQYDDVLPDGSINTIEVADYELFAIPITPAFLEQNGFVKSERYEVWKIIHDDYEMRITPWRFAVIFLEDGADKEEFSIPRPNFVHELQHAFRLCGIEKEVVL